jgi:hypothetical protein
LITARYERRSLMVTPNHPFGEWTTGFPDAVMTLAAVDRLVHHSTIFEMNVESSAQGRRRSRATQAEGDERQRKREAMKPLSPATRSDIFSCRSAPLRP